MLTSPKSQKFSTLSLTAVLLVSALLSGHVQSASISSDLHNLSKDTCEKGCEICKIKKSTNKLECKGCLKAKVLFNNTCEKTPATGNCLVYGKKQECLLCQEGYALKVANTPTPVQTPCVQTTIKDCVVSAIGEFNSGAKLAESKTDKEVCLVCKKGAPSKDRTSCKKFDSTVVGEGADVKNCQWGERFVAGDKAGCYRCAPGYASNQKFKCVKTTQVGCLLLQKDDRFCEFCDAFKDYYQNTPNTCAHLKKKK